MTEPKVIIIHGGFTDDDRDHATVGGAEIYRDPAEPFGAFRDRAVAAAKAGGHGIVVIGGFSDACP